MLRSTSLSGRRKLHASDCAVSSLIVFFFPPSYFSVKDIERRKETSKSKVKDPEKTNASKPAPEGQIITHVTYVIF